MNRTVTIAPVRKSVTVQASQARAFEVFTAGISRWWPPSHTLLAVGLKEVIIEPRAGGRWIQIGVDGSESINGHVRIWQPPSRLVLSWEIDGDWKCDPQSASEVEVNFVSESATVTRVELEHRNFDRMRANAEGARASIDSPGGWSGILQRYLETVASA
jgi:uncharacterized protein YndB with AHSA1/START domain